MSSFSVLLQLRKVRAGQNYICNERVWFPVLQQSIPSGKRSNTPSAETGDPGQLFQQDGDCKTDQDQGNAHPFYRGAAFFQNKNPGGHSDR